MKALVTGAAGFIGSSLCATLAKEGHDVAGFDDLSSGSRENLSGTPDVELIEGDLRDSEQVTHAARGCEVIIHQGALRSVPVSVKDPRSTTDINVGGTLSVLMAAREVGARVVSASSSSVYGDQTTYPVREDVALLPQSPYAASKLAGEIYCQAWWRGFGVPTISLRYFNVYGPRQDPDSEYSAVIPRFIMACMKGTAPVIYGDGEQSRDFTYIEDVVRANILAAGASEDSFGLAFNVGGGATPTSVNRLLSMIAEITGKEPEPSYEPARGGDIRQSQADVSRAGALLGYEPAVPIEEGLRRTVEWFVDNAL